MHCTPFGFLQAHCLKYTRIVHPLPLHKVLLLGIIETVAVSDTPDQCNTVDTPEQTHQIASSENYLSHLASTSCLAL